MEPKNSLQRWHKSATGPYPEPDYSNPYPFTLFSLHAIPIDI
jgi:hypothetical protein